MTEPPRVLTPELERLLAARPAPLADAVRRRLADLRPCVMLDSSRLGNVPLRGRLVDRLLRRSPPPPQVSPLASKFGGMPYLERASELKDRTFIGQVNFAEATQTLASRGSPVPTGMPGAGILAVDLGPLPKPLLFGGYARWYPQPAEGRAVATAVPRAVAKYEARIAFRAGWSLRGLDWFDAVPSEDHELWDCANDFEMPGVDEDARSGHKLFGHANEARNEHYGFVPAPGRSSDIRDYALVWRITFDNPAAFAWGTNWLYAVIHRDDLRAGAFERTVVTGANA